MRRFVWLAAFAVGLSLLVGVPSPAHAASLTTFKVSSAFCEYGTPRIDFTYDATADTATHTLAAKVGTDYVYGPLTTVPGETGFDYHYLYWLAKGTPYRVNLYMDGQLISSVTGTIPSCAPPTVSVSVYGTTRVGSTVVCATSVKTNFAPVRYNYSWQRNGKSIRVYTRSYKLTSADYGKKITCTVRVTDRTEGVTVKKSAARTVLVGPALVAKIKPTVGGTAKVGYVLRVTSNGTWSPTATKYTYQWRRLVAGKWVAIKYATRSSYRLTSTDRNRKISLRIVAYRYGYTNGSAVVVNPTYVK